MKVINQLILSCFKLLVNGPADDLSDKNSRLLSIFYVEANYLEVPSAPSHKKTAYLVN
jgi:hypothetical protein